MKRDVCSLSLGVALVVLGIVLRYPLGHIEIPIFGMPQLGLVLMICGLLDIAVSTWALAARLRS